MWDISWCENSSLYKGLTSKWPWCWVCLGTWGVSQHSDLTDPPGSACGCCTGPLPVADPTQWPKFPHPVSTVSGGNTPPHQFLHVCCTSTTSRRVETSPLTLLHSLTPTALCSNHTEIPQSISLSHPSSPNKPQPKSPFPKLEEHYLNGITACAVWEPRGWRQLLSPSFHSQQSTGAEQKCASYRFNQSHGPKMGEIPLM